MAIEVRRDRDIHRAGRGWFHAGWQLSFVGTGLELRPVGVWATRR